VQRLSGPSLTLWAPYAFDLIILLISARSGISSKSSSLTRVQSMPVGAALLSAKSRAMTESGAARLVTVKDAICFIKKTC
jgi:hypothetical protein